MQKHILIVCLLSMALCFSATAEEAPYWKPRLAFTASANVWSPGGADEDIFEVSMGGSVSLVYWYKLNKQISLSISHTKLKTKQAYWMDEVGVDTLGADTWELDGSLWTASLEHRWMLPADRINFVYFGIGVDYYHFGPIEGFWEVYQSTFPTYSYFPINEKRNPSDAGGIHVVPGMFFIFYKKVYIDVGIQLHYMIDGNQNPYWLVPRFSLSWRVF